MAAYLVITKSDGTLLKSEYNIDVSDNRYMDNPFPGRPDLKSATNPLFELESFRLGVSIAVSIGTSSGPKTGRPDFGDLTVTRKLDIATTALFAHLVSGESVKFADVLLTKATGGQTQEAVYSAFGLGTVLFSSQHWSDSGDDEGTVESLSCACQTLWTAYRQQKPDGSFAKWTVQGWNRTRNQPA